MRLTPQQAHAHLVVVVAAFIASASCGTEPLSPELPAHPPSASPIVFVRHDGNWNIYSIKSDGSALTRLTDYDQDDLYPSWFDNHRRIAFVSTRDSGWIYSMKPDGSDVQLLFRTSCALAWMSRTDLLAPVEN